MFDEQRPYPETHANVIIANQLNREARMGFQIMTGKPLESDAKVPSEFTWRSPGLSKFITNVAKLPVIEHLLVVGQGKTPKLDGTDYRVTDGLINVERIRADDTDPIIEIHSHPGPLSAHTGDLPSKMSLTSRLEVDTDGNFSNTRKQIGIEGVLYPKGVGTMAELYWLDLYCMPNLKEYSEDSQPFTIEAQRAFIRDQHLLMSFFLDKLTENNPIARKVHGIRRKLDTQAFLDGLKGKDSKTLIFAENLRKREVERFCRDMGIVQFRAATTLEKMKKGINSLTFERIIS